MTDRLLQVLERRHLQPGGANQARITAIRCDGSGW